MTRVLIATPLVFVALTVSAELRDPDYVTEYSGFSDCGGITPWEFVVEKTESLRNYSSVSLGLEVATPRVITTDFRGGGLTRPWAKATTINHFAGRIFLSCDLVYRLGLSGQLEFVLAHEFAHYINQDQEKSIKRQLRRPSLAHSFFKAEVEADRFAHDYLLSLENGEEMIENAASLLDQMEYGFLDEVRGHCPHSVLEDVKQVCSVTILKKYSEFLDNKKARKSIGVSNQCKTSCYWYAMSNYRRKFGPFE